MILRRNRFRPRLECLESRDNPSNLLVAFAGHTLTITGDTNNDLTILGNAGDATQFQLSSGSDTFNGQVSPYESPTGVQNLTLKLLGNNDSVTFDNTVPIDLQGNLSINGGNGVNDVFATDLTVQKNFSITNGTDTSGTDENYLTNLTVGGSLKINNGNGNTDTEISRNSSGISTIAGSLSITNGTGYDGNFLGDTNVGGNVTIANGAADASGDAGYTEIYNQNNTSFRSVIKGNVSVSYLNGIVDYDGIWDTEILGNVTFNHGTGSSLTNFDGYVTSLPVVIRGNLTFTGSGTTEVTVGTEYMGTGMIVGKNLTITTGSGSDMLTFNKLEVDGATKLTLGNGDNTVTIDDSTFVGTFKLTTGSGADTVNLDTNTGTSLPTTFDRPVLISQGAGADGIVLAGSSDANQELIIMSTFIVHYGGNAGDYETEYPSHEIFPFHTFVDWIP